MVSITKRQLMGVAAGVGAAGLVGTRRADAANTIRIMVGGYEKQIYLPAKLCERLGYFKDEGLDGRSSPRGTPRSASSGDQ